MVNREQSIGSLLFEMRGRRPRAGVTLAASCSTWGVMSASREGGQLAYNTGVFLQTGSRQDLAEHTIICRILLKMAVLFVYLLTVAAVVVAGGITRLPQRIRQSTTPSFRVQIERIVIVIESVINIGFVVVVVVGILFLIFGWIAMIMYSRIRASDYLIGDGLVADEFLLVALL